MHICIQNENGNGCEYKACNELKPNECHNNRLYDDDQNRICFETDDKKGCEYKDVNIYLHLIVIFII